MDTSYIRPREQYANPLLEGATNIINIFTGLNEQRRRNQEERSNNIMKLASQLDFESTISSANKKEQMDIAMKMNEGLNKIIKEGRTRRGGLSSEDNLKAMMLMKEANARMADIGQKEKLYFQTQEEMLKNRQDYDPQDIIRFTQAYIDKGEIIPIQKIPIPDTIWMKKYQSDDGVGMEPKREGNYDIFYKKKYLNPKEREKGYFNALMQDERQVRDLQRQFMQFKQDNPQEAGEMETNYGNEAFMEYGRKYRAQLFNQDEAVGRDEINTTSTKKDEKPFIKGIRNEDGTMSWETAGDKVITKIVTTMDGKQINLYKAPVTGVKVDKKGNPYIEVMNQEKVPGVGWGQTNEVRTTYRLPYAKYKYLVNDLYNFEGIGVLDNMKPKKLLKGTRSQLEQAAKSKGYSLDEYKKILEDKGYTVTIE